MILWGRKENSFVIFVNAEKLMFYLSSTSTNYQPVSVNKRQKVNVAQSNASIEKILEKFVKQIKESYTQVELDTLAKNLDRIENDNTQETLAKAAALQRKTETTEDYRKD